MIDLQDNTFNYIFNKIPSNTEGSFLIFDLQGRVILNQKLNTIASKIDISYIFKGVYIYEIITDTYKTIRGKLTIVSK